MRQRGALYAGGAVVAAALSFGAAVSQPEVESHVAPADGQVLFRSKGCAACHDGPDGESMTGAGPSLADAAEWAGDRVDGLSAAEYLAQSMRSPSAFISPAWAGPMGPSVGMPLLQLSDDEVDALVDYLLDS